ncbi:MAG: hypothetical protein ABSC17_07350 [Thermacetogeniaceae bacterium]
MAGEKTNGDPGFFDLLSSFKLSSIFKKKEPEEEAIYPLADAKHDWATALEQFHAGNYDQATLLFRRAVENLLKANCPGWGSKGLSSDLLILSKKAYFSEPPVVVTKALAFLNPHCTRVKSVYNYDFANEVKDKSYLVIRWIAEQRPSYSTFDPDLAQAGHKKK